MVRWMFAVPTLSPRRRPIPVKDIYVPERSYATKSELSASLPLNESDLVSQRYHYVLHVIIISANSQTGVGPANRVGQTGELRE